MPDTLANQIAAGEVVERPASVIKELVENSIDAGATRVQIDVELGGRRLMRVTDDGEGMHRDDAVLAFERHATSKIAVLDDLARIGTLGFRGEALPSIASVARVELKTKRADTDIATLVQIEGGRLVDVKDAARDTGTTVAVRDLFFNTPARRKFMRSEATENYHLTSIVTRYALAHPEIAFVLTNNGREILRVSRARDLKERAYQTFGAQLFESLIPVNRGREFIATVSGFISAPRERRTNRDSQYFFVNRRFVRDKTIANGLIEGYRSVLPHGVYPVAFLFVEMPLEEIDVNVHPAKTEIRFRRTEAVKDVIAEAVRNALASAGIRPEVEIVETVSSFESADRVAPQSHDEDAHESVQTLAQFTELSTESANDGISMIQEALFASTTPAIDENDGQISEVFEQTAAARQEIPTVVAPSVKPVSSAEDSDSTTTSPEQLPPLDSAAQFIRSAETNQITSNTIRPLGQLHESFIIAADDEGLLLIDQHVAHERILFDKYRRSEGERQIESQNLLLPETLDLSPAQLSAFALVEDELAVMGFSVMRLSGRTIAVKSIPTDLAPAETRNLMAEILDSIDAEKRGSAKATFRDDIAASLACRSAVKINMKLTPEKMQWLIDRLLLSSSPTTCPHGRPVILRLTMKDIERGFHRV
ncbi:MAG TPA: DNA mismatch repair endonuclease MutL [Pyrinomonadaceae bacterium]|nr:DNA mismatch repair endonuclease MutL [Pyrinomonadaceae bacterium]